MMAAFKVDMPSFLVDVVGWSEAEPLSNLRLDAIVPQSIQMPELSAKFAPLIHKYAVCGSQYIYRLNLIGIFRKYVFRFLRHPVTTKEKINVVFFPDIGNLNHVAHNLKYWFGVWQECHTWLEIDDLIHLLVIFVYHHIVNAPLGEHLAEVKQGGSYLAAIDFVAYIFNATAHLA